MAGGTCTNCDNMKIENKHGYLSSLVADQTGCGSSVCPWLVLALPGKVHEFLKIIFLFCMQLCMCVVMVV